MAETTRQWLQKNKEKFAGNRKGWIKTCIKELRVNPKTVYDLTAKIWPNEKRAYCKEIKSTSPTPKFNQKDIISPEEFLKDIDIVQQVLDFLNNEVQDGYVEEDKIKRRFGISISAWKEIGDLPLFIDRKLIYYKSNGGKTIVWSSKKGIEKARQTISMAKYEI